MRLRHAITAAALSLAIAGPAIAQPAPPPAGKPTTAAQPFMAMAGESDVFEIASSQIALTKSSNPDVKAFATMLIDHHTQTTNMLLKQAKAAGLTPPPAPLSPAKILLIDQLYAAAPTAFDRTYLSQQVPAHEQALALHTTYARSGDTPQLQVAAKAAVPFVQRHLDGARKMLAGM